MIETIASTRSRPVPTLPHRPAASFSEISNTPECQVTDAPHQNNHLWSMQVRFTCEPTHGMRRRHASWPGADTRDQTVFS